MDLEAKEKYLQAGRVASKARHTAAEMALEGTDLFDVAKKVEGIITDTGAGFAFPINLSLNDIAAHFTPIAPGQDILRGGDMLKIDLGVEVDGYLADTSTTVVVGMREEHPLVKASREALEEAIKLVGPNRPVEPVGRAIEGRIRKHGFKPIENLTGHLMKRNNLHAGLSIPNVKDASDEFFPDEGAVAIEPFATDGEGRVVPGKEGNIYRLMKQGRIKTINLKNSYRYLKKEFPSLPFTSRWIGLPGFDASLSGLVRKGIVHAYPVLKEARGGKVSQHEHTILFDEEGVIVTTL